jgi:hypothetical protein
MQVLDVQPLKLDQWLQTVEQEYFAEYLPEGGAAAKFVVGDSPALARLVPAAGTLAARHGMLSVHLNAGATRLHMLQDVFFAIAGALPWDELVQRYLEALFSRNGYPRSQPWGALSMAALAREFGVAANLLARSRDQWLSHDLWEDPHLAQDFRAAMLRLCLARLEPTDPDEGDASPVAQWLRGEKIGLALLRQYDIAARISRTNARAMLISLCHWLRKAGPKGLLLTLDLRPALRPAPLNEGDLRYSPAAVMDLYEVLREVIDDLEHLPGLFLLGFADQELMAGDRRRTLDAYKALEMRIWPDVRPGDRQNPLAPLVTVSA